LNNTVTSKKMKEMQEQGEENLAFVFPPGLSKKIKRLQKDIDARSAGEVLIKAISLLEFTLGRKLEVKDDSQGNKWEIDEFEQSEKRVEIKK